MIPERKHSKQHTTNGPVILLHTGHADMKDCMQDQELTASEGSRPNNVLIWCDNY